MCGIAPGTSPRRLGLPAGVMLIAALALLAAACAGSPSSAGSDGSSSPRGSSSSRSAVGYSACMRSHGVPNFPDPDSSGNLPKGDAQLFGVSGSQLQAARTACQPLLPDADGSLNANSFRQCVLAGDCPPALVQQALTEMRNFAGCMRSHGVPTWPDPTIGPNGGPYFDLSAAGISRQDAQSSQVSGTTRQCGRREMPDVGGVPVG
jgi:hypothetical protein